MFGLFGKKKVKAADMTVAYVDNIFEVAQAGFTEIAGYLNEEKEFAKSPNISEAENEWFIYIVFAGNIINLEKYFTKEQAEEFTRMIAARVVHKLDHDPDTADQKLYDYEQFLRKLNAQTKSLVKSMSMAIFHKYDLNRYQSDHFQKLNSPSPVIMKQLNEMVEYFLWNWDDYLSKYKVTI